MNLPYTTVQDLVIELRRRHFPGLNVLPYNRFDVEHSQHWWLSPTGEKAAFPYGKLIFTTGDWAGEGRVFCGFNVEKGILYEGDWNKNCVMNDDWFWHRFLDVANMPLYSAVSEAAKAVDDNLMIFIAAGPLVRGQQWSRVMLDVSGADLTQTMYEPGDGLLAPAAGSSNFAEFADALRAIAGAPSAWQWIDVHVGYTFEFNTDGSDGTERCAEMLSLFLPWIKATY